MSSARYTLALLALALPGCLLVTDGDSLSAGCPEGEKDCEGRCVSTLDPDFGCGRSSCAPCGPSHATATCSEETSECAIGVCVGVWADCDGDPENGCEVNIDTSSANCGACGASCEDQEQAEAGCGSSACYVRRCAAGYLDCDGLFENGCEVDGTSDPRHCGACGSECGLACKGGACTEP